MAEGNLFLGIDIGTTAAKALLVDEGGSVRGAAAVPSRMAFGEAGENARKEALSLCGAAPASIRGTVSTGYGRRNVPFADRTRSEISCHAAGAFHHFGGPITVIDIGGQDNKVIRVGEDGGVLDFDMNRKCAAGTGVFLEEIARRMDLPMAALDRMAKESTERVELGSFCTVFAFTEIIALVRAGKSPADIVRAAYRSMARRIVEMQPLEGPLVLTGGVAAHNPVFLSLLSEESGLNVRTPPDPLHTGALGAALHALKLFKND